MIVGADLAIRHGSIVDLNGRVLHQYEGQLGLMSSIEDLFQTARAAANHTPTRSVVCIDWDRTMGNWSEDAQFAVLVSLMIGFYGALCRNKGCEVCYVSPALIRVCLGLQERCSKDDVHFHVRNFCPLFEHDPEGDLLDAWLLAYTRKCSKDYQI